MESIFEVVVEYYSEHKNTASIVNSTIYKDTKIGNWLGRQEGCIINALPKEFVDKLETSFDDWEWKTKDYKFNLWNQFLK